MENTSAYALTIDNDLYGVYSCWRNAYLAMLHQYSRRRDRWSIDKVEHAYNFDEITWHNRDGVVERASIDLCDVDAKWSLPRNSFEE